MNVLSAIAKCEDRLERAETAVNSLLNATTFPEAERAWSQFLAEAAAVYSKLEQVCKANSKSTAWFGQIKKERREDQLLSYIHHARNSDEHTISDITKVSDTTISFEEIYNVNDDPTGGVGKDYAQAFRVHELPIPSLALLPVHDDRYNDTFEVPGRHLDQNLMDWSPQMVAQLALQYLQNMLSVARALVI